MALRARRGTNYWRKQQRYRITDDDEEETNLDQKTEDCSNKFGGVLASLHNRPPSQRRKTAGKVSSKDLPSSSADSATPTRTGESSESSSTHETPSPPSSILVNKESINDISPLPLQQSDKGHPRNQSAKTLLDKKRKTDDISKVHLDSKSSESKESSSYESDESLSSDDIDDDFIQYMRNGNASEESDHYDDKGVEENQSLEVDENDVSIKEEKEDDLSSDEEFEFDDDEEFDPNEDGDFEAEPDEDDSLCDFIAEETPPPKRKRPPRESARKAAKNLSQMFARSNRSKKAPYAVASAHGSPVETPDGGCVCGTNAAPNVSISHSRELTPGHHYPRDSTTKHFPVDFDSDDESDVPIPVQSPSVTTDGEETEIEETPAKIGLPARTLAFDSPESLIAIIVDSDNASSDDDLDDVLVAEVVEDAETNDRACNGRLDRTLIHSVFSLDQTKRKIEGNDYVHSVHIDPKVRENDEIGDSKGRTAMISSQIACKLSQEDKESMVVSTSKASIVESHNLTDYHSKENNYCRQEGIVKRGKWSIGARIGKGSFGEVFVGMNTQTGTLMAVKVFKLKGVVLKDIRTEIELLRFLNHQNIVRYYGAQMDDKSLNIFQEWVPGGNVESLLKHFGSFSLEVIQSYLSQTLTGLTYLHENNVIHRDIKGSNILVNDEGVVKLADFGASRKLANLEDNLLMSMTVRGTPYYMAPEVFEEKYSSKADIWGIGCVAVQMVTAKPPWKDQGFNNPISLFNHVKKVNGPPTMSHPAAMGFSKRQQCAWHLLEELVRQCFHHDSSERPSASELKRHPFFLTIPDIEDEKPGDNHELFSPGHVKTLLDLNFEDTTPWDSTTTRGHKSVLSPRLSPFLAALSSPIEKSQRIKSIVQWRTSFLSPPRPDLNPKIYCHSSSKESPLKTSGLQRQEYLSPSPDAREWPEWARAELKKEFRLNPNPISETNSSLVCDITNMMGSLALSTDFYIQSPTRKELKKGQTTVGSSVTSNLAGLNFLEEDKSATFEI